MHSLKNLRFGSAVQRLFLVAAPLLLVGCTVFFSYNKTDFEVPLDSAPRVSEQLRKDGKYQEAIAEYEKHIAARLADPWRPDTENPYFYKILIGDTYLEMGDAARAEDAYVEAKDREVSMPMVIDRLRRLGSWYADHDQLEMGLTTLQKYRALDTLLFDSDIDSIHKRIVAKEEQAAHPEEVFGKP